jgi:hypothetical protein
MMKNLVNETAMKSELNSVSSAVRGINELIDLVHEYTGQYISPDDILNAVRNEKQPVKFIFERIVKLSENSFSGKAIEQKDYPSIKSRIDGILRRVRLGSGFTQSTYQEGHYLIVDDKLEQALKQKYTLSIDPIIDKYTMARDLAIALNNAKPLIEMSQYQPSACGLKVENGTYSVDDNFFIDRLLK